MNVEALGEKSPKGLELGVCSSAGRAAISKVAGRGFESLHTRLTTDVESKTYDGRQSPETSGQHL